MKRSLPRNPKLLPSLQYLPPHPRIKTISLQVVKMVIRPIFGLQFLSDIVPKQNYSTFLGRPIRHSVNHISSRQLNSKTLGNKLSLRTKEYVFNRPILPNSRLVGIFGSDLPILCKDIRVNSTTFPNLYQRNSGGGMKNECSVHQHYKQAL